MQVAFENITGISGSAVDHKTGYFVIIEPGPYPENSHILEPKHSAGPFSRNALGQSETLGDTISISASEYAALLRPSIIGKLRLQEPSIQVKIVVAKLCQRSASP